MSVPKDRRYGCWAGNPEGYAEKKDKCIEQVWGPGRGIHHHQCDRKRGYGPDGEYCKQHSPEYVAAKRAEEDRKYKLKRQAEDAMWERKAYDAKAGEYCRRHGLTKEQLEP